MKLTDLPTDITNQIIGFLPYSEINKVSTISKGGQQITNQYWHYRISVHSITMCNGIDEHGMCRIDWKDSN